MEGGQGGCKVGSATRASQSQTSGENLKNSAKCSVAFSHHNCIYKATRPPAQVLELLLSRLKPSSQVIKYVSEEADDVLTCGSERRERTSPLSKHKTHRLPQMQCPCCLRPEDGESKGELEVQERGAGALSDGPWQELQPWGSAGCSAPWPPLGVKGLLTPLAPFTNSIAGWMCCSATKMGTSDLSPQSP